MPSTVGEDYHGAKCTGTVIAETHNDNCQLPTSERGEATRAPYAHRAPDNQTTIAVDLELLRTGSEPATEIFFGERSNSISVNLGYEVSVH